MIEVKSITHTIRLYSDRVHFSDLFKVVMYCGYRGDKARIPRYYTIVKGESCLTDLRRTEDELLAAMKSNTRNEIRRAEKEGCEFQLVETFDEFIPFYNSFCTEKGLSDLTSRSRMGKYEKVLLTKAVKDGAVLAMHANVLDANSKVAFLLYSCSQRLAEGVDRKLIGWGNRFLHWRELQWLKAEGYETYDWSGVCTDPKDPRYSIGQFKLAFGGTLVDSWTLKSPLYAWLEKFRGVLRSARR